jgi:hypothetical protein
MANRYFNKQVAESRKPLAVGGPAKSGPRIRSGGPRKSRPSLADDVAPRNPRKKLKPFPNQAVPDRPKPKTGRPSRPMPRPRVIRDLNKRLKELQEKRKGLDPKNPKLKKSIDDLKNQIRQRPKTMIPLRDKKAMGGRMNTSRMNRLEELGRVDSEKAYTSKGKRNLRDEKKRIVKEVAGR